MADICLKCGHYNCSCHTTTPPLANQTGPAYAGCGTTGPAIVSDSVVMYMAGFPSPDALPPFNPGDGSLPIPTVPSNTITFTAPLTEETIRRVLREVLEELDAKKAAARKALREKIDTKRKVARAARKAARLAVRAAKAAEREADNAAAEVRPRKRRKHRPVEVE